MNRLFSSFLFFPKAPIIAIASKYVPWCHPKFANQEKEPNLAVSLWGFPEISNIFRFLAAVNPWQKMIEKLDQLRLRLGIVKDWVANMKKASTLRNSSSIDGVLPNS